MIILEIKKNYKCKVYNSFFQLNDGNEMSLEDRIMALVALNCPIEFEDGVVCNNEEELREYVSNL